MALSKGLRRILSVGVGLASLTVASPGHAGDDAGIAAFFRDQFGIGAAAPQPVPPSYDASEERPVIIRPLRRRHALQPVVAKIVVGPVAPVSIYEDRTLRPGDAVMTAQGLRVFRGGHNLPYTEADFAALTDQDGIPKQVQKELVELNKSPRT